MRRLIRFLLAAICMVAVAASAGGLVAQEPTPAGRLGGGAPLDATIPVSTVPPTATPDRGGSPTAGASPTPDASPVASPVAGGLLDPVDCTVAPRPLDDVAALLMLTEPPAAPPAPTAAEWTSGSERAAQALAKELVACGNAGRHLAAYALLSDAYLVDYLIGTSPAQNLSTIRTRFFGEEPPLIAAEITGLETRPGAVGTVYLWLDLAGTDSVTATLTVAEDGGGWRITGIEVFDPEG